MGFERNPVRMVTAGTMLIAGAVGAAGWLYGQSSVPTPLIWMVCILAAGTGIVLLRRGLKSLPFAAPASPLEVPVGVPQDHAALSARLLATETQLEHAPIALFRVERRGTRNDVEPLNANARRLLAPGRATDAANLPEKLASLAAGQRGVVDFDTERGTERALAISAAMTVDGVPQQLAALMPVENELEAEAMQAWQKLVHVLTHEIMNSLTPVASLSNTWRETLKERGADLPEDVARDLEVAFDAISRRAESLTHFVSGYRALASVPDATPQRVMVSNLFARLAALTCPNWQERGGRAVFSAEPESLELMADEGQLEQALMNLIMNAAEATGHLPSPEVVVAARLTRGGRLRIEVRDNGPGVQDDLAPRLFTPFFSTKNRGSGIGLAMARQLISRSGGTVRYAKSVGSGALFVITF
jgi:signal transduction histidine kinase